MVLGKFLHSVMWIMNEEVGTGRSTVSELPLQPMQVQPEKATSMATRPRKHSTRGLLPELKVGRQRKSEPAGTT